VFLGRAFSLTTALTVTQTVNNYWVVTGFNNVLDLQGNWKQCIPEVTGAGSLQPANIQETRI
jgi:hypothetical protein